LVSQGLLDHAEKDTRNLIYVILVKKVENKFQAHNVILESPFDHAEKDTRNLTDISLVKNVEKLSNTRPPWNIFIGS
jgi:hypothetical protein